MTGFLGRADLAEDLRALGVEAGDGLFVHTALGKVGRVIGGPRGLIEALIDAVGETGLLAMPGFSRDAYDPVDMEGASVSPEHHARIRDQVPGYDPDRSNVAQNGAVPEAFRSWPGVARSPHPTSSVLMLGPDAAALSTRHDPDGWATGPDTPWGRLRARPQMKVLLIGVRWNRCSALHAAETLAAHRRTKTRVKLGFFSPFCRETKVAKLGFKRPHIACQKDIFRFDVAVNDPLFMSKRHPLQHIADHRKCLYGFNAGKPNEIISQGTAGNVFIHDVSASFGISKR